MTATLRVSEKVQEASYKVAELIVKAKKPHTKGEALLKPVSKGMVRIVLGLESASEISKIPHFADTISRRIIDMSRQIEDIMKEKINNSQKFSLQIDESTGPYNSLLCQRGLKETSLCECGAKGTPEHVVWSCPIAEVRTADINIIRSRSTRDIILDERSWIILDNLANKVSQLHKKRYLDRAAVGHGDRPREVARPNIQA